MGLTFFALYSKFHSSLVEKLFGFGWVGGWVGQLAPRQPHDDPQCLRDGLAYSLGYPWPEQRAGADVAFHTNALSTNGAHIHHIPDYEGPWRGYPAGKGIQSIRVYNDKSLSDCKSLCDKNGRCEVFSIDGCQTTNNTHCQGQCTLYEMAPLHEVSVGHGGASDGTLKSFKKPGTGALFCLLQSCCYHLKCPAPRLLLPEPEGSPSFECIGKGEVTPPSWCPMPSCFPTQHQVVLP